MYTLYRLGHENINIFSIVKTYKYTMLNKLMTVSPILIKQKFINHQCNKMQIRNDCFVFRIKIVIKMLLHQSKLLEYPLLHLRFFSCAIAHHGKHVPNASKCSYVSTITPTEVTQA